MKYVTYTIMMIGITMMFIMIFLTMMGKDVRNYEIRQGLTEAENSTLQGMYDEDSFYKVEDTKDLVGGFLQRTCIQVESDSDVDMAVAAADEEKGVLSVKMEGKYKHPNGADGTEDSYKTIIMDTDAKEEEPKITLIFYTTKEEMDAGAIPYSETEIMPGKLTSYPEIPQEMNGKTLKAFADASGNHVTENTIYQVNEGETQTLYALYAVYE